MRKLGLTFQSTGILAAWRFVIVIGESNSSSWGMKYTIFEGAIFFLLCRMSRAAAEGIQQRRASCTGLI
jgi:hypothetical protein